MIDLNQEKPGLAERLMAGAVPFGKYRGQPWEVLKSDPSYVEWLMSKDWFRERFGNVYTLIVNNFQEPNETPEHNKLQALFLDENLAATIFKKCWPDYNEGPLEYCLIHGDQPDVKFSVEFEVGGFDVYILMYIRGHYRAVLLELKPSVGDDYPAVLRQIKANFSSFIKGGRIMPHECCKLVLFLESFNGIGVTRDQFVKIFSKSGIEVIFRESMPLA